MDLFAGAGQRGGNIHFCDATHHSPPTQSLPLSLLSYSMHSGIHEVKLGCFETSHILALFLPFFLSFPLLGGHFRAIAEPSFELCCLFCSLKLQISMVVYISKVISELLFSFRACHMGSRKSLPVLVVTTDPQ
uniref:Uncharacterized protein n=1 Tax=Physcomitrium patens TaxID=3218 RepID=A0A2K1K4E1_PHYPA|nr:hypothetical protein PHYPA_013123 [Physcomitrium patens]